MVNPTLTIGIDIIEGVVKKFADWQLEKLTLTPPDNAHAAVTLPLASLSQTMTLHADATVRFAAVDGRVRIQVTDLNVLGLPFPVQLIMPLVQKMLAEPEEAANEAIEHVALRSGLRLNAVSVTTEALVFTFAP